MADQEEEEETMINNPDLQSSNHHSHSHHPHHHHTLLSSSPSSPTLMSPTLNSRNRDFMTATLETSATDNNLLIHNNQDQSVILMAKTSNMPLDMNIYATRKTVAQGMMDIALMTANASQLKYVLLNAQKHRYLEVTLALITLSILIQILIGILLIVLGRWNINYRGDQKKADLANNTSVILIFLVTVVNVLISAFGPADNNLHSHSSSLSSLSSISSSSPNWSPLT